MTTTVARRTVRSASRPSVRPDRVAAAAARGAAGIFVGFAGLQVALAAGAPLGEHVWGGSQPAVLPPRMRVVSIGAAVVLGGMAQVVRARAGLTRRPSPGARGLGPATWAIAGYMALNTLGNAASTSDVERWVFTPLTAIASASVATVAWRSPRLSTVPA